MKVSEFVDEEVQTIDEDIDDSGGLVDEGVMDEAL